MERLTFPAESRETVQSRLIPLLTPQPRAAPQASADPVATTITREPDTHGFGLA